MTLPPPPDPEPEVTLPVAVQRPEASSASVRARMQKQMRRDTDPEVQVRRRLHAAGIRYRVDNKLEADLRTRGDIVWRGLRIAVFIDGCYWHGCPLHATRPKANADWWARKLDGNVTRDRRADATLAARGWKVLRYWEHESPDAVADAVIVEIQRRRAATA